MKKIPVIIVLLATVFTCAAQTATKDSSATRKPENQVKQFFFVMLLKGANRTQDSATAAKIQSGHMTNISRCIMKAN